MTAPPNGSDKPAHVPAHVGRVPLIVGVTGHRDLVAAERPRLEQVVEAFFGDLRERFPDLPIVVVTPLAEGADQLVARVAHRLGLTINVLVPMPLEDYRQDFTGASAEGFEEMLGFGARVELPWLWNGGHPDITAREAQYEYLGIYLAAHCHVLLALWDGGPSEGPGGTGQVVEFHLQNTVQLLTGAAEPHSAIDFSEDESDLTYHVPCAREGAAAPVGPRAPCWLTRDELEPRTRRLPERYQALFERQSQLNRDLARLAPAILLGDALPEPVAAEFPLDAATADAERGVRLFVAVDALALRFQQRALLTLRGMFAVAAATGLSFILYADFPGMNRVIWLYLGLLGTGFLLYLLEARGGWYRRYVDYRSLAEGLRVQCYWELAGVRMPHIAEFPHDKFMKREELELGWIRHVMRYAGLRSDAAPNPPSTERLDAVVRAWVGDGATGQSHYYRSRVQQRIRRSRLTARLGGLALASGIVTAVTLAVYQARLPSLAVNLLIALMAGLPFLAAVRSSYAQRIAERELIDQFAHMDRIFHNARSLLAVSGDDVRRRATLRALGEQALQEVGLWLLRQRERPLSGSELFRPG